ncbi:VPLPA-CTERM sorting domain-containing protein [Epibacterium ulvae]|uniref:VPLPA-CTERM sorting domain-containing protein n=1 Tax=Epibacterium ulvae TaxID=1156985 RepID=UPI001BFC9140|nr:VPLPA-CTERM sorting domain-containing protein [Epibacterium ulvae]
MTENFELSGFGFGGDEGGDFDFITGFTLSGFGPNGSGGDLQLDFVSSDVNPFANASVGFSFAVTPETGIEFAQDLDGDIFVSRFNGSGSVSFQVVESFDEPAPVPLPASGLLLIGALGAAGALRKRKS